MWQCFTTVRGGGLALKLACFSVIWTVQETTTGKTSPETRVLFCYLECSGGYKSQDIRGLPKWHSAKTAAEAFATRVLPRASGLYRLCACACARARFASCQNGSCCILIYPEIESQPVAFRYTLRSNLNLLHFTTASRMCPCVCDHIGKSLW